MPAMDRYPEAIFAANSQSSLDSLWSSMHAAAAGLMPGQQTRRASCTASLTMHSACSGVQAAAGTTKRARSSASLQKATDYCRPAEFTNLEVLMGYLGL